MAQGTDCRVSQFIPVKVKGLVSLWDILCCVQLSYPQMAICIFSDHYCLICNMRAINSNPEIVFLPRNRLIKMFAIPWVFDMCWATSVYLSLGPLESLALLPDPSRILCALRSFQPWHNVCISPWDAEARHREDLAVSSSKWFSLFKIWRKSGSEIFMVSDPLRGSFPSWPLLSGALLETRRTLCLLLMGPLTHSRAEPTTLWEDHGEAYLPYGPGTEARPGPWLSEAEGPPWRWRACIRALTHVLFTWRMMAVISQGNKDSDSAVVMVLR